MPRRQNKKTPVPAIAHANPFAILAMDDDDAQERVPTPRPSPRKRVVLHKQEKWTDDVDPQVFPTPTPRPSPRRGRTLPDGREAGPRWFEDDPEPDWAFWDIVSRCEVDGWD